MPWMDVLYGETTYTLSSGRIRGCAVKRIATRRRGCAGEFTPLGIARQGFVDDVLRLCEDDSPPGPKGSASLRSCMESGAWLA
jgi:hypothetical protein